MKTLQPPIHQSLTNLGFLSLAVATFALAPSFSALAQAEKASARGRQPMYSRSESCENCHDKIYSQHVNSMHSRSFSNPVFQAQYVQEIVPGAYSSLEAFKEARSCTACHAPVAHRLSGPRVLDPAKVEAAPASVTCDFCHTLAGFHGDVPGNGNYQSEPGPSKFGPFKTRSDWHHTYSELQTRSEFCAICHSVRNRFGLDIKSTYAEWQQSRHARNGIQCQDCHMSVNGFLTEGRPVHATGQAASMTLGSAPNRSELYTHRFQGARSHSQIEGAIQLAFELPTEPLAPGQELDFTLLVDNSRTGHKMPSGSVELRYLWLDVYAVCGTSRVEALPLSPTGTDGYDLTGVHEELDQGIFAGAPANGHRVYRTLLIDRNDNPTLSFYLATKVLFDNRLNASEVRRESYRLRIPQSTQRAVRITAVMYYVPYPDAFAAKLGLPRAEAVQIASASTELSLPSDSGE